jgi:hypothetical protein
LAIKEVQIKTASTFHPTPVRMANTNTNAGKVREKGTLVYCWWDYVSQCNHSGKQYGGSSENQN